MNDNQSFNHPFLRSIKLEGYASDLGHYQKRVEFLFRFTDRLRYPYCFPGAERPVYLGPAGTHRAG